MKKVLIVSATDIIGGAEIVLHNYLKDNNTHKFYILTSDIKEIGEFYQNLSGIEIIQSPLLNHYRLKRSVKSWINLLQVLFFIKKICAEYDINVLYGNNSKDFIILSLYKTFIKKDIFVISHIHDMLKKKIHKVFFWLFAKKIDLFITPSKICANLLVEHTVQLNKIVQVYNGVEQCLYRNSKLWDDNDISIYFIGNINVNKRVDLFIDIVEKINAICNRNVKGYIIGDIIDNDYFDQIKEKIKNLSNECQIEYLGKIEHEILLNDIFPKIKFVMLTSNSDTLPTVIMEAMAAGCVVFARKVDGVPEIISDGDDGVLFNYNDPLDKVVEKILLFLENKDQLKMISINAVNKIKTKFSNEKKKQIINDIIEKCEFVNHENKR